MTERRYTNDIEARLENALNRAADEIERLRADNEWLRGVMKNAVAAQDWSIARTALEQNAPSHADCSNPCPTCGFVVWKIERKPFVIEDDTWT